MIVKLSGTSTESTFTCKVDPYVPFTVEMAHAPRSADELCYWRSTDGRYLCEVKIDASSGAVGGFSLVLVPREWTRAAESVLPLCTGQDQRGLPHVDLEPWRRRLAGRESPVDPALRRIDEKVPFAFVIARDGCALLFGPAESSSVVRNGALRFLFTGEKLLSGVVLTDVAGRELHQLREWYLA